MNDISERIVSPVKQYSFITFKVMIHALIFGAIVLAIIVAWYYRDVIRYRFEAMGRDNLVGLLFSEMQNGTHYGFAGGQ